MTANIYKTMYTRRDTSGQQLCVKKEFNLLLFNTTSKQGKQVSLM